MRTLIRGLKVLLLLLCCCGVAAKQHSHQIQSLTVEEKKWLKEHPVITFAPDPDFPPIEYFDTKGKFAGITADYLKYLGEWLGVQFEPLKTNSWSEAVESVEQGQALLLSAQLKTPDNQSDYFFSNSYLEYPVLIMARENVVQQQHLADLSGKKLAVVSDYPDIELIRKKYPDITLLEVENVSSALRLTAFGQADAMIVLQPVASYHLEKEGITNLHVVGLADFYTSMSFAVSRNHPMLAQILNKALNAIPAKEKQRIQNRWIISNANLSFDYGPLIYLSLLVAAVILLLGGWLYQTHYQKKRLQQEISIRQSKEKELQEVMLELQEVNQQLEVAIITDPLTGAMNRRGFYDLIESEHNRIIRYGGEITLLMLDIDFFKQINDKYGHSAGDLALRKLTEICADGARIIDVISRVGGEEFAILLPNTSVDNAVNLAERIRQKVASFRLEIDRGSILNMTVSIGVAAYGSGDTPNSLFNKADQALYYAKNNGRDQVVCFDDLPAGRVEQFYQLR